MNEFDEKYFKRPDDLQTNDTERFVSPDRNPEPTIQPPPAPVRSFNEYHFPAGLSAGTTPPHETFAGSPEPQPSMPFNETVKKPGHKKYIFMAIGAAAVNFAILVGIFGMGYKMGLEKNRVYDTSGVISNLQQTPVDHSENTPNATQTVTHSGELTTVEISKKVGPAVVGVTSTMKANTGIFGSSTYAEGTGSGIIISDDGFIVTNNHVIDGASAITVTLNTGSEYEAELIGSDSKTDLAVLKISPKEPLTVAELGDSSTLEVGERAVAIGNPLGMEFFGSTTQGIVSAVNRTITVENTTMTVIQTDAAINQGNSGGALVNAYGQVIGINAVKISSSTVEGMGFAIPISDAKPVLQDLIEHGYVKGRPVIGITSRDVNEYMAQRQGWPMGVQVMGVEPDSGAAAAGLEQGDIIIKADGKAVTSTSELNNIKDKHKAGETIKLEVYKYRSGNTKTVSVKLKEQKP